MVEIVLTRVDLGSVSSTEIIEVIIVVCCMSEGKVVVDAYFNDVGGGQDSSSKLLIRWRSKSAFSLG